MRPAPTFKAPEQLIREALRKKKMTQEQLARIMGVAFSTISKLVNGHSRVTTVMAQKLETVLGIRAEVLLQAQTKNELWKAQKDS